MRPWKRYGKDRLYVNDAADRSLGYLDRSTDTVHVEDERDLPRVLLALGLGVTEPRLPEPLAYAVTVPRLASELADNMPGASARAKAKEHRSQAPVRTLLARALGVHTDERAWRVGAKGEQTVAAQLDGLGDRWTVLHDVPVGERGANIDHVVIGPPGVFTVNSKWHAGKSVWVGGSTVLIDGRREPYVPKSRHEAERASRLLSAAYGEPVPVVGIVAVLAQDWTIRDQPRDGSVLVMRPSHARELLRSLPVRYGGAELERLAWCARRSTVWRP